MKKLPILIWTFCIVLISCKKNDTTEPDDRETILSDSTIVVTNDVINNSLILVDSNQLTFTAGGNGVDKIKIGSILISDISSVAPIGFLRKIIGVSTNGSNKVFTTEQASLTDAIINGEVSYNRSFNDSDIIGEDSSGVDISAQQRLKSMSFTFAYSKVLYDKDGLNSTTYDQIKVAGEMKVEPTFYFDFKVEKRRVTKFVLRMDLKNTNKISAEIKALLPALNTEKVLKTFQLKPFTIWVSSVLPITFKQWIAIVIGIDGTITAKVIGETQNVNLGVAGVSYENNSWKAISTMENSFTFPPPTFEGPLKVEPWLQVRHELRPYGIKAARIFIGAKGSLIFEASAVPAGLTASLKWGVKFNAKAQMQIWHRTVLDYEQIFFEKEYPIFQANSFAFPTLTTTSISNIAQNSAQTGGNISSDGGTPITARGICFSTSPNPTTSNTIIANGTGIGSFTSIIGGLIHNTTYYVRAYATNSAGTGYGNEIMFTTLSQPPGFTYLNGLGFGPDINGNVWNVWGSNGSNVWNWQTNYVGGYLHYSFKVLNISGLFCSGSCRYHNIWSKNPTLGFEISDVRHDTGVFPENNQNDHVYLVNVQWNATGYHVSVYDQTAGSQYSDQDYIYTVNQNTYDSWTWGYSIWDMFSGAYTQIDAATHALGWKPTIHSSGVSGMTGCGESELRTDALKIMQ